MQGAEGHPEPDASPSPSTWRSEDGAITVTRPNDEGRDPRAARPVPHADRQHGHRRHRRATARRWRSSASATGCRPRARTWSSRSGFSHPVPVTAAGGHHLPRRVADPVRRRGHRQAAGRRGRRATSASSASPTRTRARACGTRASRSAARSGRLVSSHGWHQDTRSHARATGRARPHRSAAAARAYGGTCGSARRSAAARQRPRLVVNRSARHIFAQLVDDTVGRTLAVASTLDARSAAPRATRPPRREQVGALLARAREGRPASTAVVFDRGGYPYHGRVAALADGAREGGLTL